ILLSANRPRTRCSSGPREGLHFPRGISPHDPHNAAATSAVSSLSPAPTLKRGKSVVPSRGRGQLRAIGSWTVYLLGSCDKLTPGVFSEQPKTTRVSLAGASREFENVYQSCIESRWGGRLMRQE